MNSVTKGVVTKRCNDCPLELPAGHTGTCPQCGGNNIGKLHHVNVQVEQKVVASLTWTLFHEYLETNPIALTISIAVFFVGPFLGFLFGGGLGVIIGFVVGLISVVAGYFAATKVRQERSGTTS